MIEADMDQGEQRHEYRRSLLRLGADKRGVTALEYGMIAALVAVVAITAFRNLGTNLNTTLTSVGSAFSATN